MLAVLFLALSLRSPISSLGVTLPHVRSGLPLDAVAAGLVTSLPVVLFATVGLAAPSAIHRFGAHRVAVASLVAICVAGVLRATTASASLFVGGTVGALAAIALGNVVAPTLVKHHFADRLSTVSALYAAAVMGGSSLGALTAGGLQAALGWRLALLGVLVAPMAAALLWAPITVRDHTPSAGSRTPVRLTSLAGSWRAWATAGCFGLVCAQAYAQLGWYPAILSDVGASPVYAATMLAVLTAAGIPTTLALPWLARRFGDASVMTGFAACTATGWLGLLIAPISGSILWSILIGVGAGSFAWMMKALGVHARTSQGVAALSGFTQGIGFAMAAVGPFGVGIVRQFTGSWDPSLILLAVLGALLAPAGGLVARQWFIEDELGSGEQNSAIDSRGKDARR
jgi:CP family cyanate transporter-like MFS transporter